MTITCSFKKCKARFCKDDAVGFFRFPCKRLNPQQRHAWIAHAKGRARVASRGHPRNSREYADGTSLQAGRRRRRVIRTMDLHKIHKMSHQRRRWVASGGLPTGRQRNEISASHRKAMPLSKVLRQLIRAHQQK